jgi:hypothetical protein
MADKLDLFLTVCSEAFRAENEVMDRLTDKAQKYVAAIGIILGFHVIEMQALSFKGPAARIGLSVGMAGGIALLLLALVASLMSMRVRCYPTFPESGNLKRLATAATDDQAKHSVAGIYLDLRDAVQKVNEKRASTIRIAGVMLTLGYLMSLLGQLGLRLQ